MTLAEDHEGLFTSEQARNAGFADSVLARLAGRGRLERAARGVYRIPYIPLNRFSQCREAVLWAQAHRGPMRVALSFETALAVFGISDANPSRIHLTLPAGVRLRRQTPKAVQLHRADLAAGEITMVEGLPVTSVSRTVADLLASGGRMDLVKQAISDARREGFISSAEAQRLRRRVQSHFSQLRAS
ncbi:MAG: type IV toxin-antitoxin system AbiEi family antitoxin domain-containing protein [Bryobacterales bacterium]|nr:type IV toxin-antitoxin system AbiEi family antitoxin domain-containing protein [Bryobacterales bacterium]